jgi:predicted membrane protein
MEPYNTNQNPNVNRANGGGAWNGAPRPPQRTSGVRIFWGIVFVLAAVAIALNAAGLITINGLSPGDFFWTIALAIILILSIPHRFWFGIFFPVMGLLKIYAEPLGLDVLHVSLWVYLLVALLLSIGFSILFHRRRHNRWKDKWAYTYDYDDRAYEYGSGYDGASASEESVDTDVVRVNSSFGNVIKYINSDNLERVEAECSFGAMKLYFDNAKPREAGAIIILEVSFGSAELFIPKEWAVNNELKRSFSGVYDRNAEYRGDEKTARVTITGDASFSSVSIIYI